MVSSADETEPTPDGEPAWIPMFGLMVLLGILFFPTIFMGRVLSPNDVYGNYEPWVGESPVEAQNPQIHDPPLAYYPMARMLRRAPASFHWNPWIASGVPGWGSAASAVLTPIVLIPSLAPPSLFFQLIVFFKLMLAFGFAYGWLREEQLSRVGATVGALVIAAAGSTSVLLLWQMTNATVIFPALLWMIARMYNGKKNSFPALVLLGITLLLSGYPAAILYGLYVSIAYWTLKSIRARRVAWKETVRCIVAAVTAFLIVSPALLPFVRFLSRTAYLEVREDFAGSIFFPWTHLLGFVQPFYAGSPMARNWSGVDNLGTANNFIEATVYVGVAALGLSIVGILSRSRHYLFWLLFLTVVVGAMFGTPVAALIERLPGMNFSPLTRLKVLVPLAVGFLAAAGMMKFATWWPPRRRQFLTILVVAVVAVELALFAGAFYPFVTPEVAEVPSDPSIEYLLEASGERVLPMFFWLMPNSAQIFGIEDVRSQWASESLYRSMLERVDPETVRAGTVTTVNALTADIDHPVLDLLGVTHFVEPPPIDILRWRIEDGMTRPPPFGSIDGAVSPERLIVMDEAITGFEILYRRQRDTASCHLEIVTVVPETGEVVDSIRVAGRDFEARDRVQVGIPGAMRAGQALLVRVFAPDGCVEVVTDADERILAGRLYGGVTLDRTFDQARVFSRSTALPRYRATWRLDRRPIREVLDDRSFDFGRTTQIEDVDHHELEDVPLSQRTARFRIVERSSSRALIEVSSPGGFLLTTSEKVDEDLRLEVDGRIVEPLLINGLFAGVPVPPGDHRVELRRRIGRDAWPASLLGILLFATSWILYRSDFRATKMNW